MLIGGVSMSVRMCSINSLFYAALGFETVCESAILPESFVFCPTLMCSDAIHRSETIADCLLWSGWRMKFRRDVQNTYHCAIMLA